MAIEKLPRRPESEAIESCGQRRHIQGMETGQRMLSIPRVGLPQNIFSEGFQNYYGSEIASCLKSAGMAGDIWAIMVTLWCPCKMDLSATNNVSYVHKSPDLKESHLGHLERLLCIIPNAEIITYHSEILYCVLVP